MRYVYLLGRDPRDSTAATEMIRQNRLEAHYAALARRADSASAMKAPSLTD